MRFTQGPGMSHEGRSNISFMSFVADRAGGFRAEELSYLMELMPLIALRLELEAGRRMTKDLLTTYLGRGPAKRVLKGDFMRGGGYEAEAAICLSDRSDEHTSELQSLMRITYAVFCLKKKKKELRDKTNHTCTTKAITTLRR